MSAGGDPGTDRGRTPAPLIQRCPACGRRQFNGNRCLSCGHRETPVAEVETATAANALPVSPEPGGSSFSLDFPGGRSRSSRDSEFFVSETPPAVGYLSTLGLPGAVRPTLLQERANLAKVSGRVLQVSPLGYEPMDFDPWRWVAIPAWGLVLLLTPVAATVAAWKSLGLPAAAIVALVSLLVLRYVFSNRLIDSWHLVSTLNGRHMVESMPVQVIRIRQWDGSEAQLRLKGIFAGGAVIEGDRIEASGVWLHGVFRVREAFCERSGARIAPRQPRAQAFAVAGLVLLCGMILWLLIAGLPLVSVLGGSTASTPLPVEFSIPSSSSAQPSQPPRP